MFLLLPKKHINYSITLEMDKCLYAKQEIKFLGQKIKIG